MKNFLKPLFLTAIIFVIFNFSQKSFSAIKIPSMYAHEAAKKGLISLSAISKSGINDPKIYITNKTNTPLNIDLSRTAFMPDDAGQRLGIANNGKLKVTIPPHKSKIIQAGGRCLDQTRHTANRFIKYSYIPDSIPQSLSDILSKNGTQEQVWSITEGIESGNWKSLDPRNKELYRERMMEIMKRKQLVSVSNPKMPLFDKIMDTIVSDGKIQTIAFTPNGGAVFIDEENKLSTSNIPESLGKKLNELKEKNSLINSISFSKNNGWVIVHDNNKAEYSNIPKELVDLLKSTSKKGLEIKKVVFTPNGGWLLTYGANGVNYSNFPVEASDLIEELTFWGVKIKTISFTKDYGWVIVFGDNSFAHKDLPQSLVTKLNDLYNKDKTIKNIAFSPSGDWIVTQK